VLSVEGCGLRVEGLRFRGKLAQIQEVVVPPLARVIILVTMFRVAVLVIVRVIIRGARVCHEVRDAKHLLPRTKTRGS